MLDLHPGSVRRGREPGSKDWRVPSMMSAIVRTMGRPQNGAWDILTESIRAKPITLTPWEFTQFTVVSSSAEYARLEKLRRPTARREVPAGAACQRR
jgi:hypothetical protein